MKNKLSDLNNHLFAQLERLSDEDVKGDELDEEIKRAEAVCSVATQIIDNGSLALRAEKMKRECGGTDSSAFSFLENKS